MEQPHTNGVPFIRGSLDNCGLSPSAHEVLMASWRTGTTKQYQTYLKKRLSYCTENATVVSPRVLSFWYHFFVPV